MKRIRKLVVLYFMIIIGASTLISFLSYVFIFKNNYCTVSFDCTGGSQIESIKIKKGSKISKPENPTKEGFVFKNWYLDG